MKQSIIRFAPPPLAPPPALAPAASAPPPRRARASRQAGPLPPSAPRTAQTPRRKARRRPPPAVERGAPGGGRAAAHSVHLGSTSAACARSPPLSLQGQHWGSPCAGGGATPQHSKPSLLPPLYPSLAKSSLDTPEVCASSRPGLGALHTPGQSPLPHVGVAPPHSNAAPGAGPQPATAGGAPLGCGGGKGTARRGCGAP